MKGIGQSAGRLTSLRITMDSNKRLECARNAPQSHASMTEIQVVIFSLSESGVKREINPRTSYSNRNDAISLWPSLHRYCCTVLIVENFVFKCKVGDKGTDRQDLIGSGHRRPSRFVKLERLLMRWQPLGALFFFSIIINKAFWNII